MNTPKLTRIKEILKPLKLDDSQCPCFVCSKERCAQSPHGRIAKAGEVLPSEEKIKHAIGVPANGDLTETQINDIYNNILWLFAKPTKTTN